MATEPRRPGGVIGWRRALRGLAVAGAAAAGGGALAQQPTPLPANLPATPVAAQPGNPQARAVAYIGTVPVTRDELYDFLIVRGGMDKLELLVNRKVIEIEAARLGVTVTALEMEAGLDDDLRGIGVSRKEFERQVLPRYGKTLFEWQYDVIRPRLLLGKMCRERMTATPDEVRRLYENRYGEKREAQVIVFPKEQAPAADVREAARTDPAKFEEMARKQGGDLGAAGGRINPVGRHLDGEDPRVEAALFALKPGEISPWIETEKSLTCVRLLSIVPPNTAVTFEAVRAELEKDILDRKINAEVPKVFEELKRTSEPRLTVNVPVPPTADPKNPPVRVPCTDPRVLAVIAGKYLITRDDLGEFLLLRGGYEKLDLLVNRRIIELEAARRNVTVTPDEVEAALLDDLKGIGIPAAPGASPAAAAKQMKADFVQHILPKYGKTLFEWTEDVIKPRVVLGKMCRDRVKVTDEDVDKAFENRYGAKREAKIIIWPKEEFRTALKQWDETRQGATQAERDANFDRIARMQKDPNLAAAAGKVAPIGKNTDAENTVVERTVFALKVGEVSHLIETPAGIMCVKCIGEVKRVEGVELAAVRQQLEAELFEKKLAKEIPVFFTELKERAKVQMIMTGPPSPRENEEGVKHLIQQAGGPPPEAKK